MRPIKITFDSDVDFEFELPNLPKGTQISIRNIGKGSVTFTGRKTSFCMADIAKDGWYPTNEKPRK